MIKLLIIILPTHHIHDPTMLLNFCGRVIVQPECGLINTCWFCQDQNLITGPFLDFNRLIEPLKEPWPLIANRGWAGCKGKDSWFEQHKLTSWLLDHLQFYSWPLNLALIPVTGVSIAGIYVTTPCSATCCSVPRTQDQNSIHLYRSCYIYLPLEMGYMGTYPGVDACPGHYSNLQL